jgi:type I restriction enzyme S subunit
MALSVRTKPPQEGWEKKSLLDMCRFIPGKAHEPYIDPLGEFVCVNSKFISTEGSVAKPCNRNITPARTNDILMVMSNLPNGRALSKCFLVTENDRLAVNQRVCILRPKLGYDAKMLFYILNRNPYFMAFDDGVNQTHLLNSVFERCEISVPASPDEQQRLGQALSDADGVVEGLERLIAKKRHIKQGAMQDLLTAKRRLPGFSGEWEEQKLGDFGPFVGGGTPSMARNEFWTGGTIAWVSSSDVRVGILDGADRKITLEAVKSSSTKVLEPGAVMFVTRSGILRRFQPVMLNTVPIAINQDIKALLPNKDNFDPLFVLYTCIGAGDQILRDCMKTGTTVESIDLSALRRFKVMCPTNLSEQRAVAKACADMDAEITALETRLHKARQIKEGMMQNLLTGRVRLV